MYVSVYACGVGVLCMYVCMCVMYVWNACVGVMFCYVCMHVFVCVLTCVYECMGV